MAAPSYPSDTGDLEPSERDRLYEATARAAPRRYCAPCRMRWRASTRAGGAGEPERFDAQARGFDMRAGLPAGAARAVARAVLEIAAVGPDDLLVELGAGTGEIGQHLIESVSYVGVDRSGAMLELFREKLVSVDDTRVRLFCMDANRPWPVGDASAAVVFASRVTHLLDAEHLIAELQRVCRSGGHFLVGRVIRDPDGVKSRLRRQRRLMLRQQGVASRDAKEATERAFCELAACGAVRVEPRVGRHMDGECVGGRDPGRVEGGGRDGRQAADRGHARHSLERG